MALATCETRLGSMSHQQEKQFLAALEQQLTQQYAQRLARSDNSVQESARCLAEIAAKVSVIEALLLKEQSISISDDVQLLSNQLVLDAENFLENENFFELEFHNGKAFRWSGENPRIDFPLLICREEAKEVSISIVAIAKPEFMQQLSIFADGRPLKFTVKEDDGLITLVAKLQEAPSKKDATLLSILLPETIIPAEQGTSADTRKLGMAIHKISVGKARKKRFKFGK